MSRSDDILGMIFACIETLNNQLPADAKLPKDISTVLTGDGGVLDSLSLVTLIADIEQELVTRFGIHRPLLDEVVGDYSGGAWTLEKLQNYILAE